MYRLLRACVFGLASFSVLSAPPEQGGNVLSLSIDGVIHPVTVGMLDRALAQVSRDHCRLLILRLDTPGGFLEATREATARILASPVPVATWVGPAGARAASAGFYLLQAGDVAAMAPGTNTGAAHPVMLVGTPDRTMTQKIENDTAASLRSVVARRGRNTDLADKAVLESRSFTDKEALAGKLIELVATDETDLVRQLDGREITRFDGSHTRLDLKSVRIVEYEPTVSQRLQRALSNPSIALGALILGGLLLYLELSTPGAILPGVVGAILVLLGLGALSILPVTWLGVSLLALALVLFLLEVKITSHGVLGLGGVAAMVLGSTLLIDSTLPELRIPLVSAIVLTVPFAVILIFLVSLVVQAKTRRVQSGAESFIGKTATAVTEIAPEGRVLFDGSLWNACAEAAIAPATQVRVLSRDGLTLKVEAVRSEEPEAHGATAGG